MILIPLNFLIDKGINWNVVTILYVKGFVSLTTLKDYVAYLLQNGSYLKDGINEENLIEILILDNDEVDVESIVKKDSYKSCEDLSDRALLLVVEWLLATIKNNLNSQLKDPVAFRETIFDVLRFFDFPQYEVDFFLSKIITHSVEKELEKYLSCKCNRLYYLSLIHI